MKRKTAFVLVLCMMVTLCTISNLTAYAEDWKLPEETQIYKPGRTMALDFGTFTVLDAGFAKKAQSIIQGSHVGYYTAKDGQALFAFKGLLYNSSDQPITLESLRPTVRFNEVELKPAYGYPAVPFGIAEYYTLEPDKDVEIVFQCTVPDGLYYDSGDILLEFSGGTLGFQRADLGNYNSVGFTAEDSKEAGDLTAVPAVQEEGVIVANQPHVDEVRAEDVSLEYDSKKGEYRIHVKLRNLKGYPLIRDKLPNWLYARVQFLDSNGDVLPNGDIQVGGPLGSFADLAVNQAGWDNSYLFVSKTIVDKTVAIRIASYSLDYIAINSDGSSQSVNGTFSDPLVIPISNILPDRIPISNENQSLIVDVNQPSEEGRFVLRNGIMFGDSRQAVKEKEVFPLSDTLSGNNLTGKATVAGYEDIDFTYYFDDSNSMKEMIYWFGRVNDKNESDSRYETIYNMLVQKYGEPTEHEGDIFPLYTEAFTVAINSLKVTKFTCKVSDFGEFAQWLIPDGDDYVKIDLVSLYWVSDKSYFDLNLGYGRITKADLDSALEKIQDDIDSAIKIAQYDHSNDL